MTAGQAVDGRLTARTHVVTQSEGMADFVRGHKTDQLAHQLVVEFRGTGARIDCASLDHIPFVQSLAYVSIPADLCLDDLAAAWVVDLGSVGVCNFGG